MDQAAFWTTHLQPGERLQWQALASPKLRRAELTRRRWQAVLVGLACLGLSAAFAWRLYDSLLPGRPPGDLGIALALPLYVALALAFLIVAIAQVGRLKRKSEQATRYAATATRLIAADAEGALLDQVDGHDIAGVILGGRRKAPDLYVLRKHDDANVRAFAIEHIDNPVEAKAILEQHFLEPAHEQAD